MNGIPAKSDKVELRISESLLTTTTEQSFAEWNQRESAKGKCIHELFREQAERTPDAVAVVYKGRQLSYRELDDRSSQVAQLLRELGNGPFPAVRVVGIHDVASDDGRRRTALHLAAREDDLSSGFDAGNGVCPAH